MASDPNTSPCAAGARCAFPGQTPPTRTHKCLGCNIYVHALCGEVFDDYPITCNIKRYLLVE
eukprot:scaffold110880_cov64-Attheya_sp.AAC.1